MTETNKDGKESNPPQNDKTGSDSGSTILFPPVFWSWAGSASCLSYFTSFSIKPSMRPVASPLTKRSRPPSQGA